MATEVVKIEQDPDEEEEQVESDRKILSVTRSYGVPHIVYTENNRKYFLYPPTQSRYPPLASSDGNFLYLFKCSRCPGGYRKFPSTASCKFFVYLKTLKTALLSDPQFFELENWSFLSKAENDRVYRGSKIQTHGSKIQHTCKAFHLQPEKQKSNQ